MATAALVFAVASAPPASEVAAAATDAGIAATPALEEIVVTATRREQDLQAVPVAVTAVTDEQLARRQVVDVQTLQYSAPTLVVWPVVANPLTATMSMRGQVEPDLVPTNDSAVGLYLNGVYIARATGGNLQLLDVQRVEVLRGPQGTLFGRNTIGGAINVVPNEPVDAVQGWLEVRGGNYSLFEASGMANIPLGADLGAVRLAVRHTQHGGYAYAVGPDEPLGDEDTDYLRATTRLNLADDWTVDVMADLTTVDQGGQWLTLAAAFPDATLVPAAAGHPEDALVNYARPYSSRVADNRAGHFSGDVWGVSATVSGSLSGASFRSISAYRSLDLTVRNADGDGTPYDLWGIFRRSQDEYQFSQEFQVFGTTAGEWLDWIAGFLYFDESATLEFYNHGNYPLLPSVNHGLGTAKNDSTAVYAEATAHLSAAVRLTAGARYVRDGRQLVSGNSFVTDGDVTCELDPVLLDRPGVCKATLPRKVYDFVPYTMGIDYTSDAGLMLYGKVTRGYRAGGYNMRGGSQLDLLTFDPESVIQFELGEKGEFLGGRLRVNAAAYRSLYDQIQLAQFVADPQHGSTVVKQNAGQARIDGGEVEATALIGRATLSVALGLVDGRYTRIDPGVAWVTRKTQLGLPKTTVYVAGDYPWAIGSMPGLLHVDYAWRSTDIDDASQSRCDCQNAYGLLNAMATVDLPRRSLQLGLWGQNLGNQRYFEQWVDTGDIFVGMPGPPRTYGVSVSYRFDGH